MRETLRMRTQDEDNGDKCREERKFLWLVFRMLKYRVISINYRK